MLFGSDGFPRRHWTKSKSVPQMCTAYDTAPPAACHVSVVVVLTPVARLAGVIRLKEAGAFWAPAGRGSKHIRVSKVRHFNHAVLPKTCLRTPKNLPHGNTRQEVQSFFQVHLTRDALKKLSHF